jgi:hypothetical protein
MIANDAVETAVDWLRDNAKAAGRARANRDHLDNYSKVVKSRLMAERLSEPLGGQERYAYSHPEYEKHLDGLRVAIEEDEAMRWLMKAAEAKIEVWRTQQANLRAEGKAYG